MLRSYTSTLPHHGDASRSSSSNNNNETSSSRKKKIGIMKILIVAIALIGVYVGVDVVEKITGAADVLSSRNRSLLCESGAMMKKTTTTIIGMIGHRLLCSVDTALETESYNNAFRSSGSGASSSYDADYDTTRPSGTKNVAFVLTIPSCPEDDNIALFRDDPGYDAFYDAAAVLRDSVCNCTSRNPESGSDYDSTLYAIIHPDAVTCSSSNSQQYDRIKILEELGYWAIIWGAPNLEDIQSASGSTTRRALNAIEHGGNNRDLMRFYAYNMTTHSVAIMMNFDTLFTTALDSVLDPFIADTTAKSIYTITTDENKVNLGNLIIKPDSTELDTIINLYATTVYDETTTTTGWDGTSVTGLDAEGFLTYYLLHNSPAGSTQAAASSSLIQSFHTNSQCGLPWLCHYNSSWDTATEEECREYTQAWYERRNHFFDVNWSNRPNSRLQNIPSNSSDFFLGYCGYSYYDGNTNTNTSSAYTNVATYHAIPDPISCGTAGSSETVTLTTGGAISLYTVTGSEDLCTLVLVNEVGTADEYITPVGRSYSGHDWEGQNPMNPTFDCSSDETPTTYCFATNLPSAITTTQEYRLVSYNRAAITPEQDASRFLIKSTFGPTRQDVTDFVTSSSNSYAERVRAMMMIGGTHHREYYRRNTQARTEVSYRVGRPKRPCEPFNRWRNFAISFEEKGRTVSVENKTEPPYLYYVDGEPRTQVWDPPSPTFPGYVGKLGAFPSNGIGGRITLEVAGGGYLVSYIPKVQFYDDPFELFANTTTTGVYNLTGPTHVRDDGRVLEHEHAIADIPAGICDYQPSNDNIRKMDYFGRDVSTGEWYLYDPTLVLRDNNPDSFPADGGTADAPYSACTSAPYNAFHDESCVMVSSDDTTTVCASRGIVCPGLPSEVANQPLGVPTYDFVFSEAYDSTGGVVDFEHQKWTAWIDIVVRNAPDQLRQRVAWAFYQIQVNAFGILDTETEPHLAFYDIFTRNAFGNFRDILKEISFNPLMARSLSFLNNKKMDYFYRQSGTYVYPDENYAREIMQLFSIGIWMLNDDGTRVLDENDHDNPIPSYTNDDILDGARAWTGFEDHGTRGNIEGGRSNRIDPLKINGGTRDHFPKKRVLGGSGYHGDGLPLCGELPARHWLRKGAKWRLLGNSYTPIMIPSIGKWQWSKGGNPYITLNTTDPLYSELCGASGSGSTNCTYPITVTLENTLPFVSDSIIAHVDNPRVVRINDNIYYESLGHQCVDLPFHNNAKTVKDSPNGDVAMCARSDSVQGSSCCTTGSTYALAQCEFPDDLVTYTTHEQRCSSIGRDVCYDMRRVSQNGGTNFCTHFALWQWTSDECKIKAKISEEGQVAIVHVPSASIEMHNGVYYSYREGAKNYFRVDWNGQDDFPNISNGCGNGVCSVSTVEARSCLCETREATTPVYDTSSQGQPQDLSLIESQLFIGALDPTVHDAGAYTVDTTWSQPPYTVTFWQKTTGGTSSSAEDQIIAVDNGVRTNFYKNQVSTVEIVDAATGNAAYTFRNPPKFSDGSTRDAYYETERVIDSYFYHPNTAPFIVTRLIQRFGISNPSPGYVRRVSNAFRTGEYISDGVTFGTGQYGDLESTIAAMLLDRESRSSVLEEDPANGAIREPLLKVIHFMRSMEYSSNTDLIKMYALDSQIGEIAYGHETVFSFFLPDHAAPGVVSSAGLVSPEAFLFDTPKITNLMKGLFSLSKNGLTSCYGGFGSGGGSCYTYTEGDYTRSLGRLSFTPNSYTSEDILDELDLLLAGGRLSSGTRSIMMEALNDSTQVTTDEKRLILAQQLLAAAPEFHTNNRVELDDTKSRGGSSSSGQQASHPYKAIVFVMMAGGADTYNLLVPHSECGSKDMYAEYAAVRGSVALSKESLHQINATGQGQVCDMFGINSNLPILQQLYNENDLAFVANTGKLYKPSTKQNYRANHAGKGTGLFGHGQQADVQLVNPDGDLFQTGVLGRLTDVLTDNGFLTARTSAGNGGAAGAVVINSDPKKSPPASYLKGGYAPDPFDPNPSIADMRTVINSLNNATTLSSGMFSETWSAALLNSLDNNDWVHDLLNTVELQTAFPANDPGNGLKLVARLMKVRRQRNIERDVFAVSYKNFDAHSDVKSSHDKLYSELNDAISSFADEMKVQNLWNDVVLVACSEFGRTLTENSGGGTDHAWGGNYFMLGGSVLGKQIHGSYPANLQGDDPILLGRGRVIPTTGWDTVWNGIAQWFGIADTDLHKVVPNRANMASLLTRDDLFKTLTSEPTVAPTPLVITDLPTAAPTPLGNLVSSTVSFVNLKSNGYVQVNGITNSDTGLVTSVRTWDPDALDGPDMVIAISITGQDFDNDGNATDSLSWKVRVQGYRNTATYMCLPTPDPCASVSGGDPGYKVFDQGGEFGVENRYVGRDGESIVFKIEDIQLNTSTPGFQATYTGFTKIWATTGSYIFGKGVDLWAIAHINGGGASGWINFPPQYVYDELQLTVGTNTQERIRQLEGSFTVSGYVF